MNIVSKCQDINDHNEWALREIKPARRMLCKCGKIVATNWMRSEYSNKVGKRCAVCFRKDKA